jgi:UDP-N-acetylmuramoyl-L-alanyl-D-glutamate--2,6-diaminopimelate ligase
MIEQIDLGHVKGITQDSRAVQKGYVFAALPGSKFDGRHYIGDAVQNGASIILAPSGTSWPDNVARGDVQFITDENPRRALAMLAARFYNLQPRYIAAVTGTNGKTSTVHFTKQLWTAQKMKAASIGTLGVRSPGLIRSGSMTTPDPVSLHAELADLAAAGVTHLAMEASSHGLDQFRLDGVDVRAAGFTNLTRDHLDYHGTMEAYGQAKARLLGDILRADGTAVLNADILEFETLSALVKSRGIAVMSYGFKAHDLKIVHITPTPHGQQLRLEIMGVRHELLFPVVGSFQVMNALCALGLVLAEHPGDQAAAEIYTQALTQLQGPPGRLEYVPGHPRGAAVYIDYAHTPDALETVLKALRPHTHGKLWCLFGCGGDRDRGKRPIMGQIAHALADHVIVTDDNPRSENPASIRQAILAATPNAEEVGDRHEAIRKATGYLKAGDVLVIAGKGHEPGQIFADRTDPFDDFKEASTAIKELSL